MDRSADERWEEILDAEDAVAFQIESLRVFLREFPEHAPAWQLLGISLADVSRFAEAEEAFRKSIEFAGGQFAPFGLCAMGKSFQYKGDFATAERCFRAAIDLHSGHTQGYIHLGAMLARLGRLEEAEDIHRRATACAQGYVDEAYHNLGLVLRARGRYAEASACFASALEIDPQYNAARLAQRDVERALRVLGTTERQ